MQTEIIFKYLLLINLFIYQCNLYTLSSDLFIKIYKDLSPTFSHVKIRDFFSIAFERRFKI